MVIKGSARGGAVSLAQHLQRIDTNERMEVRELRGVMAEDLDKALQEMEAVASGARSARHFYHASINTRADEVMTPEQWQQSVDRLERELDLTDQPRAVVAHVKEGRAHVHVVWSRIDLATMKAIPDSHNYRRHELVARELEKEFGHAHVQGAHIGREGERPDRTPSHAEMQQAERSGKDPKEAKAQLTEIWNRIDSGRAFVAAIEERGWTLARGDRRDFVLVDEAGEVHSLARRIDGVRAKDIRARMAHINVATLPTADQAKEMQRERQEAQAERAAPAPEIVAPQLASREEALDTEQHAAPAEQKAPAPLSAFERLFRHNEKPVPMNELARHYGASPAPEVRQAPPHPTQQAAKPMPAQLTPRAPTVAAPPITPRAEALDKLAQADKADQKTLRTDTARAFGDAGRQAAQDARQERQEESARREQAAWRKQLADRAPEKAQPADKGLKVINAATGTVSKLGDFVLGLLGGSSAPAEPAPDMRSFVTDPAARKAQQLARLEAKRQEQAAERALERMYDDMRAGKGLSSADIQNLTHEHLRTISAHGDDGVRQMVEDAHRRADKQWRGEERERD